MLARVRESGRAVPEVYNERAKTWHPYPALDTLHDARPVEDHEALSSVPGSSMGDLQSTGDTGNYGDLYERERVPLRS